MADQKQRRPDDARGGGREGARVDAPATLMGQFGRTRASFLRLVNAHVGLLKAEIGEIVDKIKVMGALAGCALVVLLFVGNLLFVGGFLFAGEWLFGSIGWGLAHGVLFGLALVALLVLGILGARGRSVILAQVLTILLIVGLAILTGSNVAYNSAASIAANLASPINSAAVVALLTGALVGALLFAILMWRIAGRGGAIGGFFLGAILGVPVGWLIAGAPWTWPPAAGFSITIGLIAWPILTAALVIPGLDLEERFGNLYPRQSIEAANETKAWLEEQWRSRQPKLGRK